MGEMVSIPQYCRMMYGCETPTKTQLNVVSEMCRNGSLKRHSFKVGRRWVIDLESARKGITSEKQF